MQKAGQPWAWWPGRDSTTTIRRLMQLMCCSGMQHTGDAAHQHRPSPLHCSRQPSRGWQSRCPARQVRCGLTSAGLSCSSSLLQPLTALT